MIDEDEYDRVERDGWEIIEKKKWRKNNLRFLFVSKGMSERKPEVSGRLQVWDERSGINKWSGWCCV